MKPFAVTWDYRCPFARNAHEHLVTALADGADWDVTFLPFSLSQVHVPEGGTAVWDDPDKFKDLIALAAGVVVRDQYPGQFGAVAGVLDAAGVPGDKVIAEVEAGAPIEEIKRSHLLAVDEWSVFGVPTFVVDGRAVFVRLMSRPQGDAALARRTIEGIVRLVDEQPDLNEFKYTTLER